MHHDRADCAEFASDCRLSANARCPAAIQTPDCPFTGLFHLFPLKIFYFILFPFYFEFLFLVLIFVWSLGSSSLSSTFSRYTRRAVSPVFIDQATFSCLNVIMAIRVSVFQFVRFVCPSVCCWRLFASWRSQAKSHKTEDSSMCVCVCANATNATSARLPSASNSIYFVAQMPDYVCFLVVVIVFFFFYFLFFTFMQRIWIGSCAILLSFGWRPVYTTCCPSRAAKYFAFPPSFRKYSCDRLFIYVVCTYLPTVFGHFWWQMRCSCRICKIFSQFLLQLA